MPEDRHSGRPDIVEADGRATGHRRKGLAGQDEVLSGPGPRAPFDHLADEIGRIRIARPRGPDEFRDVGHDVARHRDRQDRFLKGPDVLDAEDGRGLLGQRACRGHQDPLLLGPRRIRHVDAEEEPVQLGLGQRVRTFLFDGVLRGDDEERVGQRIGLLADGDLAFLHRLQEGRLGLGRRAVDLVGQNDVGEDRALDESELAPAVGRLVHEVGACNVRGHQVGRELNPPQRQVHRPRQAPDHHRFGEARHAHQQAVSADEDGG